MCLIDNPAYWLSINKTAINKAAINHGGPSVQLTWLAKQPTVCLIILPDHTASGPLYAGNR